MPFSRHSIDRRNYHDVLSVWYYYHIVVKTYTFYQLRARDVREWLSTFPFPPIPIYSILIPPTPIPKFMTYSHSHGIPVWAIPIPSHSHSVNAKVVYN